MKMRLIVSCLVFITVLLHGGLAATAVTVGLYAPDRYNGIPETCLLPMDFGYCRAKVKRYYFDMRRMKCAMFYFGGCAGNVNNFKSLEECNRVCLDGYGDYDSPNDVVPDNKASGRDYRSRGNVNSSSSNNSGGGGGGGSTGSNSNRIVNNSQGSGGVSGIKNITSATSFGSSGISGIETGYKSSYNKYNSNNYNTNIGSNVNGNNSGVSGIGSSVSAVNNSTKILRNRSDDNLDEYDYEEI